MSDSLADMDIIGLGEPMVEFNQQPDGMMRQGVGGDTSNAAISAARQGAKVGYITRLGNDVFGDAIVDVWRSERIDVSQVRRDDQAQTGIYFVTHDKDGHHYSYYRRQSAATRMRPTHLVEPYIASAKILHVSAISQAISGDAADTVFAAIDMANRCNTRVSYDTNLRLALWPESRARGIIHEAMTRCDIALPSYDDAVVLTGHTAPEAIVDFYLHLGATVVALKLGSEGVIVATSQARQHIAPPQVRSIDANGAGDTFAGAFLAGLAEGRDSFDAARYANTAAAISTTRPGAVSGIPSRRDVDHFLGVGAP